MNDISFKNVEYLFETLLEEGTHGLFDQYNEKGEVDYRAHYSKSNKGIYRGSLHVYTDWGDAHANIELNDPIELIIQLKKKVLAKIDRKRLQKQTEGFRDMQSLGERDSKMGSSNLELTVEVRDIDLIRCTEVESAPLQEVKVLIVDDDFDSLLPVNQILNNQGCRTILIDNPDQAINHILKQNFDLIILDWWVAQQTGANIIRQAQQELDRGKGVSFEKKTKIITYSSAPKKKIKIPNSRFFYHADHWRKPMRPEQIKRKTQNFLPIELVE